MRAQEGQGTIEYLAVVLLVAAVMGAAGALAAATGLGERAMDAFRRALCVVSGGVCDEARGLAAAPCVRASREHADGGHLQVLVARIGGRAVVLREQRADGSVALTVIDEQHAGADVGTGVEAHVRWGTSSFAVGSELRAAVLAESASGRNWVVPDGAAADRLLPQVALADRTHRAAATIPATDEYNPYPPLPREVHVPEPDATFSERGSGLTLDFHAGNRTAARLSTREAYGERVDRRTGRRTVYVRTALGAAGKVSFAGDATGEGEERFGITYDRSGRPVDLVALSTLDVAATASLPPKLLRIAGWLRIPLHGSKHVETEQHLDLTDPANADAAQAFLGALGDGALGVKLTAAGLRGRLEREGTLSVRTYATDASAHQVGGHAKLGGIGAGGEAGSEDASGRLLAAVARGPGGAWTADPACRPSAA